MAAPAPSHSDPARGTGQTHPQGTPLRRGAAAATTCRASPLGPDTTEGPRMMPGALAPSPMLIGGIALGLILGLLAGGPITNVASIWLRRIGILFGAVFLRFGTEIFLNAGFPLAERFGSCPGRPFASSCSRSVGEPLPGHQPRVHRHPPQRHRDPRQRWLMIREPALSSPAS